MKEDLAHLGNLISTVRKQLGLSQEDLGEETGLKRGTISSIERGDQKPTIEFLLVFSSLSGLTMDEILKPDHSDKTEIENILKDLSKSDKKSSEKIRNYISSLKEEYSDLESKYHHLSQEHNELQRKVIELLKLDK